MTKTITVTIKNQSELKAKTGRLCQARENVRKARSREIWVWCWLVKKRTFPLIDSNAIEELSKCKATANCDAFASHSQTKTVLLSYEQANIFITFTRLVKELTLSHLKYDIQKKAIKQYVPMVLFIILYIVVLTIESVDEILKCDHSNQSYWTVLSCDTAYYAVQVVLTFYSANEVQIIQMKAIEQYFPVVLFIMLYKVVITFEYPKVWPFKWKLLSSTFLWCCLLCCTWWS